MITLLKKYVRSIIRMFGLDIVRYNKQRKFPHYFDELDIRIYDTIKDFTKTDFETVHALIQTVKYIIDNKIDGSFVECGVWKGASIMTMALALKELGDRKRDIYLYDTFSGMVEPTKNDFSYNGQTRPRGMYCSPLEEVKNNVYSTGYPNEKFHFIEGKVEDTLSKNSPGKIALLKLDTAWYESTKHELVHLYPFISNKGVITINFYGGWIGTKKAVDEYISENNICILLNKVADSCLIGLKIL